MKKTHAFSAPVFILCSAIATTFSLSSCSTTGVESAGDAIPLWARQSPRTVERGSLIFMESDDDPVQEKAVFKAEASALADVANECSLIPQGVHVDDHFEHKVGHLHQAYAKVTVAIQACEQAKKALTPEAVRALANPQAMEQVKKFQDLIEETPEAVAAGDLGGSDAGSAHGGDLGLVPSANGQAMIRDEDHYYVVREQILLSKQDLILSPQKVLGIGSAEALKYDSIVLPRTEAAQKYLTEHSQLQASSRSWSYYRHNLLRPRINTGGIEIKPIGTKSQSNGQPGAQPKVENHKRRRNIEIDPTVK